MAKKSVISLWLPGFGPDEIHSAPNTLFHAIQKNYRIPPGHLPVSWNTKTRIEENIAALQTLKFITLENRSATLDEKNILSRYVGWGGIPEVFGWGSSYTRQIQDIVTQDEWQSMRESVNNAHYTTGLVISAMWAAVEKMGFKGGKILEPALGIGHFIGLCPEKISAASSFVGVEIDPVSSGIAKALYEDATILDIGLQYTNLPDNYFDLTISNIPFGSYKIHDPAFKRNKFLIHDYFFAKAMGKVKPGGMVAFITSIGTMDKQSGVVRQYLSERADLVAAIRLPREVFNGNANASVTTDIVFLRKRRPGEVSGSETWLETQPLTGYQKDIHINEYFHNHPYRMLGNVVESSNPQGRGYELVGDGDLSQKLQFAISGLPADIFTDEPASLEAPVFYGEFNDGEGEFRVEQGILYQVINGQLEKSGLGATAIKRIAGMVAIRDSLRELLALQIDPDSDSHVVEASRKHLNGIYDAFVSKFGAIHQKENRRIFKDPSLPSLMSIEEWEDDTMASTKTEIFTERTAWPYIAADSAESVSDAMLISLNLLGKVDAEKIGALCGMDQDEAMKALEAEGRVFFDPNRSTWVVMEEYLAGNVKQKLVQAEAAASLDPRFDMNVEALKEVIPEDIPPCDIHCRLGSPWIPPEILEEFVDHLFGADKTCNIHYAGSMGTWIISRGNGWWRAQASTANKSTYGTSRLDGLSLIDDALNQRIPTIYDELQDKRRVINSDETEAARAKLSELHEAFREWLWNDEDRSMKMARIYNDSYNTDVIRKYEGSHLDFPGMNVAVKLRPHQKNGVWRILQGGNTLLAHKVGFGKTFTMQAASMESKRLGLANKPIHVVPNHMLLQYTAEFLRLYPHARLLAASRDDLSRERRKLLVAKIVTGNYDAIILTHSSFEKIMMSSLGVQKALRDEIFLLDSMIDNESERVVVKKLELAKKRLQARLELLVNAEDKDTDNIDFETLGIDMMFIDEAHYFKNLYIATKMSRVAGIPQTESQRAFDMYLKTRHIMEKRGDASGVVMATATPISNTMAEMYTMQRYMRPDILEEKNVEHFDSWAANFGEAVTAMEVAPDGSGYRVNTRFSKFTNLPELLTMFYTFTDIVSDEEANLLLPMIEGGKPEVVECAATPELREFVNELVKRAAAVRSRTVEPEEDNMLKITGEGRKAALDMRLINPYSMDHPDSKVNQVARYAYRIWNETREKRLTQLLFCDISTPDAAKFNAYDEISSKLQDMGVPESEIAFIHDCKNDNDKDVLFKKVRRGVVRFLFGSTDKMGVGTNVQRLIVAQHDIDAPWRPSDVEQRLGRTVRQGNSNPVVKIFRYVTSGSFDAYMWQTLETKARFISQVMSGYSGCRIAEDIDARALTYSEIKAIASGNPLVREKAAVDNEIIRLGMLRRAHDRKMWSIKTRLGYTVSSIQGHTDTIRSLEADLKIREDTTGKNFRMTINRHVYTERVDAGTKLLEILSVKGKSHDFGNHDIGNFAGFPMSIELTRFGMQEINFQGEFQTYHVKLPLSNSEAGIIASVEYKIRNFLAELNKAKDELCFLEKQRADLENELQKPVPFTDELEKLYERQSELNHELELDTTHKAVAAA